ncbi:hypothetical protein TNCT_10871 [Trichonephila clavata]|uniref:Uncharacterized protein n=1 Tax=Trichonephila clavata TaxID=2740835 RepID=A0A8X6I1A4_TRICU|nr:hypothetical protein TNCT_10871 [Trichonephila clavata]
MDVNKERIRHVLQFDKVENASQAAKIVSGVYGPDTVTANYEQFLVSLIPFRYDLHRKFDKIPEIKLTGLLVVVAAPRS